MRSWREIRAEWMAKHTPEEQVEIEQLIAQIRDEERDVLARLADADALGQPGPPQEDAS